MSTKKKSKIAPKPASKVAPLTGAALYIATQNLAGFKVGDRVKVVSTLSVVASPSGWAQSWDDAMDSCVDETGTITTIDGAEGIKVSMEGPEYGDWWFPWFVLERTSGVGLRLNDDYSATFDPENDPDIVKVACQDIPVEKVLELADKIRAVLSSKS